MSKWVTVSTPRQRVTEFGVVFSDLEIEFGPDLKIEDGIIYIPSDMAYIVSVSDTSNMGTIVHPFLNKNYGVILHEDSLWTFDAHFGPSYDYKKDMLEELPDWVKVGGSWGWMDGD